MIRDPWVKKIRGSAHAIGAGMLSFYGIGMVLSLAVSIAMLFVHSRLMGQGLTADSYLEGTVGGLILSMVMYLLPLAPPYLFLAYARGFTLRDLLGRGKAPLSVYGMCFGMCLVISLAASILTTVLGAVFGGMFGVSEASNTYIPPMSAPAAVLQFLYIAILPPMVEELCFRGYVFLESRQTAGTIGAALLSAGVFALSHQQFSVIPLAVMFGFFAACVREKYDTILPAMIGHMAVNGLYFMVNFHSYAMSDAQYLPFMAKVNGVTLILGALAIYGVFRRNHYSIEEMFAFSRPAPCPEEKIALGYLTSPLFVAAVALMVGTAIYYLQ